MEGKDTRTFLDEKRRQSKRRENEQKRLLLDEVSVMKEKKIRVRTVMKSY